MLHQWRHNSITPEQAIGYMLQHLALLYQRDTQRGERVAELAANLEELANRVAGQAARSEQPEPKRKRRR